MERVQDRPAQVAASLPSDVRQQERRFSAHQLHRTLDIGYEAAWFMAHRIREAMRDGGLAPLGGDGGIVEADETYFGTIEEPQPRKTARVVLHQGRQATARNKRAIVSLVERGGRVRSFHVAVADKATSPRSCARTSPARRALHTDESRLYIEGGDDFAAHETVNHSAKEYARDDVHHQFSRRLLLDFQTRHARRLSALRREAFASLSCRIRFPLQSPRKAWLQRWRTCRACREGCCWQASHVSGASLSPSSNTL